MSSLKIMSFSLQTRRLSPGPRSSVSMSSTGMEQPFEGPRPVPADRASVCSPTEVGTEAASPAVLAEARRGAAGLEQENVLEQREAKERDEGDADEALVAVPCCSAWTVVMSMVGVVGVVALAAAFVVTRTMQQVVPPVNADGADGRRPGGGEVCPHCGGGGGGNDSMPGSTSVVVGEAVVGGGSGGSGGGDGGPPPAPERRPVRRRTTTTPRPAQVGGPTTPPQKKPGFLATSGDAATQTDDFKPTAGGSSAQTIGVGDGHGVTSMSIQTGPRLESEQDPFGSPRASSKSYMFGSPNLSDIDPIPEFPSPGKDDLALDVHEDMDLEDLIPHMLWRSTSTAGGEETAGSRVTVIVTKENGHETRAYPVSLAKFWTTVVSDETVHLLRPAARGQGLFAESVVDMWEEKQGLDDSANASTMIPDSSLNESSRALSSLLSPRHLSFERFDSPLVRTPSPRPRSCSWDSPDSTMSAEKIVPSKYRPVISPARARAPSSSRSLEREPLVLLDPLENGSSSLTGALPPVTEANSPRSSVESPRMPRGSAALAGPKQLFDKLLAVGYQQLHSAQFWVDISWGAFDEGKAVGDVSWERLRDLNEQNNIKVPLEWLIYLLSGRTPPVYDREQYAGRGRLQPNDLREILIEVDKLQAAAAKERGEDEERSSELKNVVSINCDACFQPLSVPMEWIIYLMTDVWFEPGSRMPTTPPGGRRRRVSFEKRGSSKPGEDKNLRNSDASSRASRGSGRSSYGSASPSPSPTRRRKSVGPASGSSAQLSEVDLDRQSSIASEVQGGPSWPSLTALTFHQERPVPQPDPTPLPLTATELLQKLANLPTQVQAPTVFESHVFQAAFERVAALQAALQDFQQVNRSVTSPSSSDRDFLKLAKFGVDYVEGVLVVADAPASPPHEGDDSSPSLGTLLHSLALSEQYLERLGEAAAVSEGTTSTWDERARDFETTTLQDVRLKVEFLKLALQQFEALLQIARKGVVYVQNVIGVRQQRARTSFSARTPTQPTFSGPGSPTGSTVSDSESQLARRRRRSLTALDLGLVGGLDYDSDGFEQHGEQPHLRGGAHSV